MEARELHVEPQINVADPAAEATRPTQPSPSFLSVVREVMVAGTLQKYVCTALEPVLRRVVREEVECRLIHHIRQLQRSPQIQMDEVLPSPVLQLIFTKPLSLPIFTKGKIKDKDNNPLQIQLVRTQAGQSSFVPLESHSLRVDIVALDGDFPLGDDNNWTAEEFGSSIVRAREGKRPLLVGECKVTLREGMASIRTLEFTDNSSWIRSRNFRLGARVSPGSYKGPRIQEAITDPFPVLDHRGELNKKHYPPSLLDKVWRLINIRKNGRFDSRMATAGITTVQDFLKLSVVNQQRLRQILGKGMSERAWDATLSHARTCDMGEELYLYNGQFTLILDPICQVWGVIINGLAYTLEQLAPQHMDNVQRLVLEAYQNWSQLEKVDGASLIGTINEAQRNYIMTQVELEPELSPPSHMQNLNLGPQHELLGSGDLPTWSDTSDWNPN